MEVEALSLRINEFGERNRGQIADSHFVLVRVLQNLCTKVGRLDGSDVLLVGLLVARILVKHVRIAGLYLGLNNRVPKFSGFDRDPSFALLFISSVKLLEFLPIQIYKPGTFRRTHESPVLVLFDSLHKEVWNPQSIKEISGPKLFLAVVFFQLQELENVCVPRLQIYGERTFSLATTLVHISGSGVVHP